MGVGLWSDMGIVYLVAIVLLALALTRVPAAVGGRNVLTMLAATAIVIAFVLITPVVYRALTPLLPLPNLVDLISKLALFVGLFLAGTQIARAYDAPVARRLISGAPGVIVFIVLFAVEVVLFAFIYTSKPMPGLEGNLDNPIVLIYAAVATAYPAYVAALLLPAIWGGVGSGNRSTRVTSFFFVVGFGLAIVRFALAIVTLTYPPVYWAAQIVSGVAAIFVALGLTCAFFARLARTRKAQGEFT